MRSESSCRLGRLDQLTDFLQAHANSSGSASETCRCVLLPSASASPRYLFRQRFRNMQVCFFALSSDTLLMTCLKPPLSQSLPTLQAALQKHAGVFFCHQLRHRLMTCLLPPLYQYTPTLQAALQKHAGTFFGPQLRHLLMTCLLPPLSQPTPTLRHCLRNMQVPSLALSSDTS
jgi:hypothetical protein